MTVIYATAPVTCRYESQDYRRVVLARAARDVATRKAAQEPKTFTQKGDFTHLAPVGHVTGKF